MKIKKLFAFSSVFIMLVSLIGVIPASAQSGVSRQIPSAGTTSPQTGEYTPSGDSDVTRAEFPGELDGEEGPDAFDGYIVNRSLSHGNGHGASVNSSKKAKSNPTFNTGFEGLNLFQQRYARGGNQFTVEPPDQGMCVGNG
jgi:hypothetical protein